MKRLLVMLVGVSLFMAACGGSGTSESETTVPTTVAPTTVVPTTVAPPTVAPTPVAPTTAAPTTVAPTTAAPTTVAPTTLAPTVGEPPVGLQVNNHGVQAGDEWVYFGYDDEDAIAAITAVLGERTVDTGWIEAFSSPYGVCPGPVVRGVEWGSFAALFTQAKTDFWTAGVPHFFSYHYTDPTGTAGITTTEGIAIGDTLAALQSAYAGEIIVDQSFFDDSIGFWSYRLATWTGMSGYADGLTPDAHITSISGGQGCGE